MKSLSLVLILVACIFNTKSAASQNVLLNILTQNSGKIKKGGSIFLEITVCNTDGTDSVPVYKLRPQISIPAEIAVLNTTGHKLPEGWAISSYDRGTIRMTNGTDKIPPNGCRVILLSIGGIKTGGPSSISGNMFFSSGIAPGITPGLPTRGDNPADNVSSTTCEVVR